MRKMKRDLRHLKAAMDAYYNTSSGYLTHLNLKTEATYGSYFHFLNGYLGALKPGSAVLEVGCGDGRSTYLLAMQYPHLQFVGTDVSAPFIEYARRHFQIEGLSYRVEDSLAFSLHAESVDMVVSKSVVEHIPDIPRWLDESARILKKKGMLIVVTANYFSPVQPLLDIVWFRARPPFAHTYWQQFPLFVYNVIMSIKKLIRTSFVYVQPDLGPNADNGGDFDAVYMANQLDIARYLQKRRMKVLNKAFEGPGLLSRLCRHMAPLFSGVGIVAEKPVEEQAGGSSRAGP
jgi:2-polyprenyl-3-methyl-5-hydroxy-6-metoxy-1,4-benzoquinol methylase